MDISKKRRIDGDSLGDCWVPVSGGFEIFVRVVGNTSADAPVALLLHGGWGPSVGEEALGLIDPNKYRIVYFHQRGWGQSRPAGAVEHNTVVDNIADCETLRKRHLKIKQWSLVLGGSNGATLAFAYGRRHPESVGALVLRGMWLIRTQDVVYNYGDADGKARHFPEAYDKFLGSVGLRLGGDGTIGTIGPTATLAEASGFPPGTPGLEVLARYERALSSGSAEAQECVARAWADWDMLGATHEGDGTGTLLTDSMLDIARLGVHLYAERVRMDFAARDVDGARGLADAAARLAGAKVRVYLVTGDLDMLCPPRFAYDIRRALAKEAEAGCEPDLQLVAAAAHSARNAGMHRAVLRATDAICDAWLRREAAEA